MDFDKLNLTIIPVKFQVKLPDGIVNNSLFDNCQIELIL